MVHEQKARELHTVELRDKLHILLWHGHRDLLALAHVHRLGERRLPGLHHGMRLQIAIPTPQLLVLVGGRYLPFFAPSSG
jgi:hypothetical protein